MAPPAVYLVATTLFATVGSNMGVYMGQSDASNVACSPTMGKSARLDLTINGVPLQGSTAMLSLLMDSPNVSTLCRNGQWQCEGYPIHQNAAKDWDNRPRWCKILREGYDIMDQNAKHWRLSRAVMVDKVFPFNASNPDNACYYDAYDKYAVSGVPERMAAAGVNHLYHAGLFVWSPLCILPLHKESFKKTMDPPARIRPAWCWKLSGRSDSEQIEVRKCLDRIANGDGPYRWAVHQLIYLQHRHESLRKRDTSLMVFSYADLLSNPQTAVNRLSKFLPCIQGIRADFIPRRNIDIFEGNYWKVKKGTLVDYAKTKNLQKLYGYDAATGICTNRTQYQALHKLDPELALEYEKAETYFRALS